MGYTVKFYKATEDYSTNNYAEIAIATLAAATLDGYTVSSDIECRLVNEFPIPEGEQTEFLGGEKDNREMYRRTYELTFLTGTIANSNFDVGNMKALIRDYFRSKFLWVSFEAFSTATAIAETFHTASNVLPITVDDYAMSYDEKRAAAILTCTLGHRWRNL